jgi:hypothetical protein
MLFVLLAKLECASKRVFVLSTTLIGTGTARSQQHSITACALVLYPSTRMLYMMRCQQNTDYTALLLSVVILPRRCMTCADEWC